MQNHADLIKKNNRKKCKINRFQVEMRNWNLRNEEDIIHENENDEAKWNDKMWMNRTHLIKNNYRTVAICPAVAYKLRTQATIGEHILLKIIEEWWFGSLSVSEALVSQAQIAA